MAEKEVVGDGVESGIPSVVRLALLSGVNHDEHTALDSL